MADAMARALWERYEPVHGLVYFAPEAHRAADALGMRGFWMGYFALRAAPLGAVPPSVVTSCFYVFHPARVARALPDAWTYATPADVLAARQDALDAAMTGLFGAEWRPARPSAEPPCAARRLAVADGRGARTSAAA
ncbi:SCO6745 family protein, partial [Streptomyces sp. NPDC003233]